MKRKLIIAMLVASVVSSICTIVIGERIEHIVYTGECGLKVKYEVSYDYNRDTWERTNYTLKITGTGDMSRMDIYHGDDRYGRHSGSGDDPILWKSIDIAYGVTSISDNAFAYVQTENKRISLPNSIKSIDYHAFYNCYAEYINIPESVESIHDDAFHCCYNLKDIYIPNSVKWIGTSSFMHCHSATSLHISTSMREIPNTAFRSLYELTSVYIPGNIQRIGRNAFCDNYKLKTVKIAQGVKIIDDAAFAHCTNLTQLTLPEGVTTIGNSAFAYSALKEITIPKSVTSIGNDPDYAPFPEGILMYVYKNSYAQQYAKKNGIKYKTIDENLSASDLYGSWKITEVFDCSTGISLSGSKLTAFTKGKSMEFCTDDAIYLVDTENMGRGEWNIKNYTLYIDGESISIDTNGKLALPLENSILFFERDLKCKKHKLEINNNDAQHWYECKACKKTFHIENHYDNNNDGICDACIYVIYKYIPGDLNDDGKVNLKDSMLLLQHLAGWEVSFNEVNADINSDGKINLKDSMLLLQYLAGWESEYIN